LNEKGFANSFGKVEIDASSLLQNINKWIRYKLECLTPSKENFGQLDISLRFGSSTNISCSFGEDKEIDSILSVLPPPPPVNESIKPIRCISPGSFSKLISRKIYEKKVEKPRKQEKNRKVELVGVTDIDYLSIELSSPPKRKKKVWEQELEPFKTYEEEKKSKKTKKPLPSSSFPKTTPDYSKSEKNESEPSKKLNDINVNENNSKNQHGEYENDDFENNENDENNDKMNKNEEKEMIESQSTENLTTDNDIEKGVKEEGEGEEEGEENDGEFDFDNPFEESG
jgi:hypothetical protein